jgi:N-acylneuraminate cytidylyltransferase|tara:strand:+ start:1234 stop:1956 length:723 start_codon:yes stop_codon:yes gene_type:complete
VKQYIVGFIFARGGSQGIPGKNIRLLAGKPLIAYAIETAFQSQLIDRVVVSTDDKKIARVAQECGAEIPFVRPKELAQNNSPEWLAWQHAIRTLKEQDNGRDLDVFVSIPPTAPLRVVEDLDNCIHSFLDNNVDVVITVKKASRHPSFNMVSIDENGYTTLVLPPSESISRRQDVSPVYDATTVAYVANPQFIMGEKSIFSGKIKSVIIPEERAVDIDTELDFQFAEYLVTNRIKTNEEN